MRAHSRTREGAGEAHAVSKFGSCPLGVFAGQVDEDPVLREDLAGYFGQWQQAIASLVQRAIQARRIRSGIDPSAAAIALLAAMQGGTMLAHLNRDDGPLVEVLDRALAQLGPMK